MPISPEVYRQKARECARLARTSATPKARDNFAKLARTWIRLADELERNPSSLDEQLDEDEPEKRTG
ncbi:MAG: hypothetical protein WCC81_14420 [Pseudolabrys sp.]|jgi:hypothetical protein